MKRISLKTAYRTHFVEISADVEAAAKELKVPEGWITVFVPHTTAGITINEHADPDVMRDMKVVLDQVVPWEGDYEHAEGNTAAHVKASMMGSSTRVYVHDGRVQLGTWQGIFFCEFDGPRSRTVWIAAG